ncbi:MAG TPA: chorismate pyruvate-lyase family protein [Steroidobacteraceae bacterium]|nr:chorismate pyruvate-lyase family protein [Steroidobacteraceae bacterium]
MELPTPERAIADDDALSVAQKVLLTTDGTVTQLLEIYTGERIRVRKLGHALVTGAPAALGVSATEPVLCRRILLQGATQAYMHAQSWLVPARMPKGMQETILQTDTPIGQLWKAARLETFREIIDFRRERDSEVAALFGAGAGAALLSRTYLISAGGAPMGLIVEKFPATYFSGTP